MQFQQTTVTGVVLTLCLSTASWCHYIPERKSPGPGGSPRTSDHIQICGNQLTSFILEACDGVVGSPAQANASKDSAQSKLTVDCCDHECPLDYLQSFCGQTPLFITKKTHRGKLLSKLNTRNRSTRVESNRNAVMKDELKTPSEVRIKDKRHQKKKGKKGGKKRKRSFKWKCAYKSFGHFLLNLDRNDSGATNKAKVGFFRIHCKHCTDPEVCTEKVVMANSPTQCAYSYCPFFN